MSTNKILSDSPETPENLNDSNADILVLTSQQTSFLQENPNDMTKSLLNKTSEIVYLCARHEKYRYNNGIFGNFEEINFVIVDKKYTEGIYDKSYHLYSAKYENIRVPTVVIGNKGYENNYLKLLKDKNKNTEKLSRSILNDDFQPEYGRNILRFDNAQYHCTFQNRDSFKITAQIFLSLNLDMTDSSKT